MVAGRSTRWPPVAVFAAERRGRLTVEQQIELILRRGDTVLYADYYGEQNLPDHLDAFVRTLNSL